MDWVIPSSLLLQEQEGARKCWLVSFFVPSREEIDAVMGSLPVSQSSISVTCGLIRKETGREDYARPVSSFLTRLPLHRDTATVLPKGPKNHNRVVLT
jgi:hypothetical protein